MNYSKRKIRPAADAFLNAESCTPSSDGYDFYRSAIASLHSASVPFPVGGSYALWVHTGVRRGTKDFDLLVRPQDAARTLEVFRADGFHVELTHSHWLANVRHESQFIGLIFRSGNGLCYVDDDWFKFACVADVFGMLLPVCPSEELLWQKAFIMERERFDGADVQHLLRSCGRKMGLGKCAASIRRGLAGGAESSGALPLCLSRRSGRCSAGCHENMAARLRHWNVPAQGHLCRGPLISRLQYLDDVERLGYTDARSDPKVNMTESEVHLWTAEARAQADSH